MENIQMHLDVDYCRLLLFKMKWTMKCSPVGPQINNYSAPVGADTLRAITKG